MDETTKQIIERITVRYPAPTKAPTGVVCKVFYDCAALSPADLARLAAEATGHLAKEDFDIAVGLAYTGIFFAGPVASGRQVAILQHDRRLYGVPVSGRKVVICDDVMHTGKRFHEAAQLLQKAGAHVYGFACIVDRSQGSAAKVQLPVWSAVQTVME